MGIRIYLTAILVAFQVSNVFSQIKINEILASNSSINEDPEYGTKSDWIEIYNSGTATVNLNGYYLTDNFEIRNKWQITTNVMIPAKGFILFWCDDHATGQHTNFKLAAEGEEIALYSPELILIDSVTFGTQYVDISYGRTPDGSSKMQFFMKPTPGVKNDTTSFSGQVENIPEFLLNGGIYNSPVTVGLLNDMGGVMRFTLDGSEPNDTSEIYNSPIEVKKTAIVRARIFKSGLIPGKTVTSSFFINEGFEKHKLPVISIASDSANFWDATKGIYVQSFKPEWEIPINIELFENNGSDRATFSEMAGMKINGLYSWKLPQKMLGIYFKKQYGAGNLEYRMFFDRNRKTFDDFALRASGSDWSYTMFRDGLIQQACHNYNMKLENMAFRPSVVYFNGKYMGIHNIREKVNEDYIASNHNIDKSSFDLVENGELAESGNLVAWNKFWNLVNKDMSIQSNFDTIANYMDIENFTDLIITEVYAGNSSIDHNTMAWKPKNGGKWKWVLMDLDRGFFEYDKYMISFYAGQTVWPLSQLLKNESYKKYLGTRLANHLFTTYNPLRMIKRIDYHASLIEKEMPSHIERWLGTTSSYGNAMPSFQYWKNEVGDIKTYASGRPMVILNDLTNYGFSSSSKLSINVSPYDAGTMKFNDMEVPDNNWFGHYPKDLPIKLETIKKPGYIFKGWATNSTQEIIPANSTWKYLDNGTNQYNEWKEPAFGDSLWKSDESPLGYGFSNMSTTISYGSSSSNKYITTYFRKSFELDENTVENGTFSLSLLREDGAVVYLNGKEIIRSNMPSGDIAYRTLASSTISGSAETTYISYNVNPINLKTGTNVFAVEVHQIASSSSDMAFDLQFTADVPNESNLITTLQSYNFSLNEDIKLTALYESEGLNFLPDTIKSNTTLYKAQSPYLSKGDIYIPENVILTIEPGVEILMSPKSIFLVNGAIQAKGTETDSIVFKLNPSYQSDLSWGALCFINSSDTSRLSYVRIQDSFEGPLNYNCVAAISAFKSNLILDHLNLTDIDSNPIAARYSSIKLTNSNIHSNVLGDLINVKYGKAYVENSMFTGNSNPDTDGIDYDDVKDGIIKNVIIRNFEGSNSDAIDIGEQAKNVMIDSVLIYNITDKGISVGQRSSVYVEDATIINCNLGFGIKDSSQVTIINTTFFSVGTPVASYEKNAGRAGGNVIINNSILSNSYDQSILVDSKSTLSISNSLSDNDELQENKGNILGNPGFNAPGYFDFSLKNASPLRLGSSFYPEKPELQLTISGVFINANNALDRSEFISIYNPGQTLKDISGYTISKAVNFTFPEGSKIEPGKNIYIAKNRINFLMTASVDYAYEWTDGSLANEGEAIRLINSFGMVIDQIKYSPAFPWPDVSGTDEKVMSLKSFDLDNHFGENWVSTSYHSLSNIITEKVNKGFDVYPNPTYGEITITLSGNEAEKLVIFSLTGQIVYSSMVQNGQNINLNHLAGQILMARIGNNVKKIVVLGR